MGPRRQVIGMGATTTAYQVRGYTLYRQNGLPGPRFGMFRHAPAGAVPAALPDGLRVVFDTHGVPSVHARLAPVEGRPRASGPVPRPRRFTAVLLI